MTFFVEKKLALGPIRFGVSPRQPVWKIEADESLSTGPSGEFVTHRSDGFFFEERARFDQPTLPTARSISAMPFWLSLKPDGTPRSWGFLALLIFGAIFVPLGLAVVVRKGAQGWVEVFLGAAMIATPIILTAQRRKQLREQEERDRVEREATERRNRELLSAFTSALWHARERRDEAAFAQLAREREALKVRYDIWAPAARRTVLLIGLQELSHRGPSATQEVVRIMDHASSAAGLTPEDAAAAKQQIVEIIEWHLLADDRVGPAQEESLRSMQQAFGASDPKAAEDFRRLRGLTSANLPRQQCSARLSFKEECFHQTQSDRGLLHVTNRRLIVTGKKRVECPLTQVYDVTVDADDGMISIRTDNPKKPLRLRVDDPIYTAGLIDLASSIDERPKGFA